MTTQTKSSFSRNALLALGAGAIIISIAMGLRQTMALFLVPMTGDLGFGREFFAFSMAIQNLLWGLAQPFAGALADRFGAARVILLGGTLYVLGLAVMAGATDINSVFWGGGMLVGFGLSGTSFAVVLGAIGRRVSAEKRSVALGIATAGGSLGQFIFAPLGQAFIEAYGWSVALLLLAGCAALMIGLVGPLRGKADKVAGREGNGPDTISGAVGEAFKNKSYILLTAGFFVCGFQISFIAVHFPAYLIDAGITPSTAALALGLVGLFNILGSYGAGVLGGKYPKRYLLSAMYALRALFFAIFLFAPKTDMSVYLFSSALGILWLGTVPLTSGLVAQIFGPRFMATLFGIVFLSHQLGSFMGVWLGGYMYDTTGSYDPVWLTGIVLGVLASLVHLPIREHTLRTAEI